REAVLAPGESAALRLDVTSPLRMTGQQSLAVKAVSTTTQEQVAALNIGFQVLNSTARLRPTSRNLDFSVRFEYDPGANFQRPGLAAVGLALRGGGLINPEGNQYVRAAVSTSGFTSANAHAAYTSDTLDVMLGESKREYADLGFSANGYGVTVEALIPEY